MRHTTHLNRRNLLFLLLLPILLVTQAQAQSYYSGGAFALGMRSTFNVFPDDGAMGFGSGGQFKIGVTPRVNTEWFADIIHSSKDQMYYRNDYHIGWSVQFALAKEGFGAQRFTPYVLAGQCFDLTQAYLDLDTLPLQTEKAGSAACQAGAGISAFLNDRLEATLQAQYMLHLTKDVHLEEEEGALPFLHTEKGVDFAGHALFTLSMNYYLFDLKR
jgi:hypothetical protein